MVPRGSARWPQRSGATSVNGSASAASRPPARAASACERARARVRPAASNPEGHGAGRAVVGVIDTLSIVEREGIGREQRIGAAAPDQPRDMHAQWPAVEELSVLSAREVHLTDAEARGCRLLLVPPQFADRSARGRAIHAAALAVGEQEQLDMTAFRDHAREIAAGEELGVIRVRHDNEQTTRNELESAQHVSE